MLQKLSSKTNLEIETSKSQDQTKPNGVQSPTLQDYLPKDEITTISIILLSLSFQGLIVGDYHSCVFHLLAAIVIFVLNIKIKIFEEKNILIYLNILAVYPPALLCCSPLQFTYCSIVSCVVPVLNLKRKLDWFHQFVYLMISISVWSVYLVYGSSLKDGSLANHGAAWLQFIFLYGCSVAYSFYVLNSESVTKVTSLQMPAVNLKSEPDSKHSSPELRCENIPAEVNELIKQKEIFILRFSHEIRNPLNSLLGNIDLAKESIKDESIKEMIEDAKVSGEILLQLLNNILDSSKIDSGKLEISYISCNIREFVEKMWLVTNDIIRKKKLYGSVYVSSSIPTYVKIDPHRIMQIVLNMTTNAAKFTDKGSVKWYVDFVTTNQLGEKELKPWYFSVNSAETEGDFDNEDDINDFDEKHLCDYDFLDTNKKRFKKYNGATMLSDFEGVHGYLRLEIVDTGCGMTQASLSNLFKKFEQVSEESSKRQIGTGLGLWITKEIAELMHGRIEVYSKKNYGTCFVILLETQAVPKNSSILKMPTLNTLPTLNCKKALVVDDNAYNQDLIKRYLGKSNIEDVMVMDNGVDAVECFKRKGNGYFNFIAINLSIPSPDGKATVRLMREHEKKENWKATKILVISPVFNEKEKKECLNPNGSIRADVYLEMPISLEVVQKVISDLEKKDMQNLAILVAEDDFFNLNLLGNFMEKIGVVCFKAKNGEEAINLYMQQSDKIALILMDCEMPVVDGFTATREITKRQKLAKKNAPIYGLTGHTEEMYRTKCKEAGMQDMLTKPIDFPSLKQLVIRELTKAAAR